MRLFLLVLVFVVALGGFLAASVPLASVLPLAAKAGLDLRYSEATGTIWGGRILDARAGNRDLGIVDVALAPAPLLRGTVSVSWRARGGDLEGAGRIRRAVSGAVTLERTVIQAELARFETWTPMDGPFEARLSRVTFAPAGCQAADGTLEARPRILLRGKPVPAPDLAGAVVCDGPALVLPLEGKDASGGVDIAIRLFPNGTYSARLAVETQNKDLRAAMETMGFERKVSGHEFVQDGQWGPGTGRR
ncbi:MAG: type II secretion system protein N [Alphaproteobacteria bacterium]